MAYNLSGLFNTSVEGRDTFSKAISLTDNQVERLKEARKVLRSGLRTCLQQEVARITGDSAERIQPKFLTQGSFAYRTINSPCRPPQQADLDDGVYLPLSYVQDTGTPSVAADTLFDAAKACAQHVADQHGWEVSEENPSCTRVIVSSDMHIDLPIYSIPDNQFRQLVEARVAKAEAYDSAIEIDWDELPSDCVLFATRDRGWLAKDPRPIRNWVVSEFSAKGQQLRRVMRYLKAWRDFQEWENGNDPKSILLMVAVAKAFEQVHGRDDLCLLAVVREMSNSLQGRLLAPWDESEDLAERLDKPPQLRVTVVSRLQAFARSIDHALNHSLTAEEACRHIQLHLGERFPVDVRSVLMDSKEVAAPVRVAAAGAVGHQNNA